MCISEKSIPDELDIELPEKFKTKRLKIVKKKKPKVDPVVFQQKF